MLAALALVAGSAVGSTGSNAAALTMAGGPEVQVVVQADFPTNMAFAPDGRLFYTEKETGRIRIVEHGRVLPDPFATLHVEGGGESGLLGLALDPAFPTSPYVYVYYTSADDGRNHIARIPASISSTGGAGNTGGDTEDIFTLLQATGIHNGGDLAFGVDGKLYAAVGETGDDGLAQDPNSVGGKILRLNPDGSIPADNPFGPDSPVDAMGIRNSFGLCVHPVTGDLWETENGPDRDDEINRIEAGKNYGWPDQLGPGGGDRFVDPVLTFGDVIVVTGCAFYDQALSADSVEPVPGGQLVFGDYHHDLHSAILQPPDFRLVQETTVEASMPSGITDVEVGPDGNLYVATEDAIERIVGARGVPFTPAGPTSRPPSPTPSPSPPGSGGGGGIGVGGIVIIAAAAFLVVDGVIVLVARRRRARRTPPPG